MIGNKNKIGFSLKKVSDEEHICQLKVYILGKNVCEWTDLETRQKHTVQWNLDELIDYLYHTIDFIYADDAFPVETVGNCAAEMDENARCFDSDNDDEMLNYYEKLNDWTYRHSWNHARSGAIVPDMMFRKVGDEIEISWWSDQENEGRKFTYDYGYYRLPSSEYQSLISELFCQYNSMWL